MLNTLMHRWAVELVRLAGYLPDNSKLSKNKGPKRISSVFSKEFIVSFFGEICHILDAKL